MLTDFSGVFIREIRGSLLHIDREPVDAFHRIAHAFR